MVVSEFEERGNGCDRKLRNTRNKTLFPTSYEWTPSRMIQWAEKTGTDTAAVVETILSSRTHPEQGYRTCLGIISLGRKYTPERLEAACKRAVAIQAYSYKSIKSILHNGLDTQQMPEEKEVKPIEHSNIRGQDYFG